MFKRAIFTDEVSQDLERAIVVAKEYDLDGLEIRSVWDKPPQKLTDADVERIRSMADDAGLAVCSIASPFYKCEIDNPAERAEHLDILRRCCEIADALGTNIIRGFTFWRRTPMDDWWDQTLAAFDEPMKILEASGKTLAIENEASTMVGTGKRLRRFLDALGSDHVGAMWDPANCIFDLDEHETPYPDGYRAIRDRMPHMHLKDAKLSSENKPIVTQIGEGAIDFRGQFRALVEDGYSGYVSLETHWRPTQLSEDELNRPGGANFSAEGEYASRLCLENWKRLLGELSAGR